MRKQPTVVGLKVCQHAIVQEKTRNVTLVNCFRHLRFADFPTRPTAFTVCIVLTDGRGEGELLLRICDLDDMEVIWTESRKAKLKDPLKEIWYLLPVSDCVFSRPGKYEISLAVDGQHAAQTVFQVLHIGD